MTKRNLTTALIAILLFACAPSASASIVTFQLADRLNDGYDYIGPYLLTIDRTDYSTLCYDYTHSVDVGQSWKASLYTLDNLDSAYFAYLPDHVTLYWKAAWLLQQLVNTTDPDRRTGIQYAAWDLFAPDVAPTTGAAPWLAAAETAAQSGFAGLDVSTFRVVNEAAERPTLQGLMIIGYPATAMPEPGTWLLLGGGLIALSVFSRRLRRKR